MERVVDEKLNEIHDEADHIIGTDAVNHKEVAITDAKNIQRLVKDLRILLCKKEYDEAMKG